MERPMEWWERVERIIIGGPLTDWGFWLIIGLYVSYLVYQFVRIAG